MFMFGSLGILDFENELLSSSESFNSKGIQLFDNKKEEQFKSKKTVESRNIYILVLS